MVTRADVVAEAATWMSTPWKHQAMKKGVGADCLGLLAGIALNLGLADARPHLRDEIFRGYGREPLPEVLDAACATYLDRIPVAQAGLADIFQLRVPRGIYPQHFAVVSRVDADGKPTHIMHATSASPRRVTENGLDAQWRSRIARAYRFRGVD